MLNNESKKKILTVKNYLKTFYDSVYELGTRMSEHKIFILAAGISFNILLYIIPLVLILVSFINIFIDPEEIVAVLEYAIENYIPNAQNYTDLLSHIIKEIEHLANSSKIAGIVGFFILL